MPESKSASAPVSLQRRRFFIDDTNISKKERLGTGLLGASVLGLGLGRALRSPISGLPLALLGISTIVRAARGRSRLYRSLGLALPAADSPLAERMPGAVIVTHVATIAAPIDKLFHEWSRLENLPLYMENIIAVSPVKESVWKWEVMIAKNRHAHWQADVMIDTQAHVIAWRALPESDIPQEGFAYFEVAPGDRGTEMTFQLAYALPGGRLTTILAGLQGFDPSRHIREGLRRFKAVMEAGEIPTIQGQPTGTMPPASEVSKEEAA